MSEPTRKFTDEEEKAALIQSAQILHAVATWADAMGRPDKASATRANADVLDEMVSCYE